MSNLTSNVMTVMVLEVKDRVAFCRDTHGGIMSVRCDIMRAKGFSPLVGETWIIDTSLGLWSFAAIVGTPEITDTDPLAVTDAANGNLLAAIDDEGKGSFGGYMDVTNKYDTKPMSRNVSGITVGGDITVGGERLIAKLLRNRPLGILGYVTLNLGQALPEATSEYGIVQLNVRLPRGIGPRVLKIQSNNIEISAAIPGTNAAAVMAIRLEQTENGETPPNPTIFSGELAATVAATKTTWSPTFNWSHIQAVNVLDTADWQGKYLFTYRAGSDTERVHPWIGRDAQFWIEDIGPFGFGQNSAGGGIESGGRSTGGGTSFQPPLPPPPPMRTQKYYEGNATWNSTYKGDGERRTDTPDTIQGYQSIIGNQKGLIGFDNGIASMINKGNSPTVDRVEVYIYFNHWFYNAGGTAVLGTHDATGPPGSWPGVGVLTDRMRIGGWPKPGGRWIDITSLSADGWRTGTNRGVSLGPGPSNDVEYYGRATSDAAIRIWYTN